MKKKFIRSLAVATIATTALVGLVSCADNSGNSSTPTSAPTSTPTIAPTIAPTSTPGSTKPTAAPTTTTPAIEVGDTTVTGTGEIVFYHTMGDTLQNALQVAIDNFEAKYPGWTIKHTQVGGYDDVRDKIIGDLQAGTQPDLAYCYADHVAQYIKTKNVVDMSKFINSTGTATIGSSEAAIGYTAEEISDFVPGYYMEGKAVNFADYNKYGYSDQAQFMMPYVKSTEVLYYNKTALDAAGLSVPTTWDELWSACEVLAAKYPKCTPLGYDSEANWFITMCEQNGWGYTSAQAPHYLFNTPEACAWLNDLGAKYNDGLFITQELYGSYTSNLFTKGAEEGSVFSIGSSGGASHQAPSNNLFEWGVARVPGSLVNGKVVNKSISQGPNLVMFDTEVKNTDEKQLMTWLFVKELLDPTFQSTFSQESGYNPCRISTFDNEDYQEFLADTTNIVAVTAALAKSLTDDFFTSPAFAGSSTARDQVGAALQYAASGMSTGEEALKDAMKKCGA